MDLRVQSSDRFDFATVVLYLATVVEGQGQVVAKLFIVTTLF